MTAYEALAVLPFAQTIPSLCDVQLIQADDYCVVLSQKARPVMALPQSRREILKTAAARQALLESLMPHGPVLCFQPGTFLAAKEVADVIAANRPLLDWHAARLKGQIQFQISVSWTQEHVLGRFRTSPELAPLFTAGEVTPKTISRAITALATRLGSEMHDLVSPIATEIMALPREDDMLLNVGVLLPETAEAELDAAVGAIDDIWSDGLRLRQIGPAPAVFFLRLELEKLHAQDLATSAALLGLIPPVSSAAIASARQTALKTAPDQAAALMRAAEICATAARVPVPPKTLYLCHAVSEDQAIAIPPSREVA